MARETLKEMSFMKAQALIDRVEAFVAKQGLAASWTDTPHLGTSLEVSRAINALSAESGQSYYSILERPTERELMEVIYRAANGGAADPDGLIWEGEKLSSIMEARHVGFSE